MIPGRRGPLAAVLGAVLLLAGCGAGERAALRVPNTGVLPPAAATLAAAPTPSPDPLLAVLERRGGSRTPNLVAIVGLDGRARNRASFTAGTVPGAGGLAAVLQPQARVVGGAVYYVDGDGVVRRLGPRGDPATVATFPLTTDQQAAAVAVSPDGRRLMATVLDLDSWHVDVETAAAGGPTVTVRSIDVPSPADPGTAPRLLQVTSWDAEGPVGLADAVAAEAVADPDGLWQGHPAHLDGHGLAGPPLGGTSCGASFEEPDGTLLCHEAQTLTTTLRRQDGSVVHRFVHTGTAPRLSPDGSRLAYGLGRGRAAVQSRDGSVVALAPGFTPSGWLTAGILVGTTRGDELAYVDLAAPGRAVDIGLGGAFVGPVQG
ncbi:MAG TPA: hypothetical protein VH134_18245 [Candidatus Dormibacteraeota bacterium]|nr:hypothetical protein [Candidatus Dormibacteraeota bacterium]